MSLRTTKIRSVKMSNIITKGLELAQAINNDPSLAKEVALNLDSQVLKMFVAKRGGVQLPKNEHIDFQTALNVVLDI